MRASPGLQRRVLHMMANAVLPPTLKEMAGAEGVARGTIRLALRKLAERGLVHLEQGKGRAVAITTAGHMALLPLEVVGDVVLRDRLPDGHVLPERIAFGFLAEPDGAKGWAA